MNKMREQLFIDELQTQIGFALFSIEEINIYLNSFENNLEADSDKFWYYAQNLIVYSGNISKILWGIKSKDQNKNKVRRKERKIFRKKLRVDEDSLLKKRFLRNALEHVDEKMEDFTSESQNIILNKNFGPVMGMVSYGNDVYDISKQKNLRHYDQYTKIFYFYGEQVNLEKIYKSLLQLKDNIENYEKFKMIQ